MIAVDCAYDRITVLRYAMAHNPDIVAAIDHLVARPAPAATGQSPDPMPTTRKCEVFLI
jgi:hypothetical protein